MTDEAERLEEDLDRFEADAREQALRALGDRLREGAIEAAPTREAVNLHFHTFFSYNAEGLSPSHIAWRAKLAGLAVAGIVDFDVLDGLEEFAVAGRLMGVRACVGIETRAFVPQYEADVLNSPGEPGVAYSVGVGFPRREIGPDSERFLTRLRTTSAARARGIVARLAPYVSPVELDYERDVIPLTPAGNATERHVCAAYAAAAQRYFDDERALAGFWSDRLGVEVDTDSVSDSIGLQQAVRSHLMKQGGPGYVRPEAGSFPRMEEMNHFIEAAGAIPAYAWLDGRSEGERDTERLLDTMVAAGAQAVNIIPDRNYTRGENDGRLSKLKEVVAAAEARGLPIFVGTEMNAPGQRFVDDFESEELKPLARAFMRGAFIAYGHTVLQRAAGLGYTSDWAESQLGGRRERNEFYEELGRLVDPAAEEVVGAVDGSDRPVEILKRLTRRADV